MYIIASLGIYKVFLNFQAFYPMYILASTFHLKGKNIYIAYSISSLASVFKFRPT